MFSVSRAGSTIIEMEPDTVNVNIDLPLDSLKMLTLVLVHPELLEEQTNDLKIIGDLMNFSSRFSMTRLRKRLVKHLDQTVKGRPWETFTLAIRENEVGLARKAILYFAMLTPFPDVTALADLIRKLGPEMAGSISGPGLLELLRTAARIQRRGKRAECFFHRMAVLYRLPNTPSFVVSLTMWTMHC